MSNAWACWGHHVHIHKKKMRRCGVEEKFIRVCQSLYQEVEVSIVVDGQQQKLSKVRTCRRIDRTLNFIQFTIGVFIFRIAMALANISIMIVVSDVVSRDYQVCCFEYNWIICRDYQVCCFEYNWIYYQFHWTHFYLLQSVVMGLAYVSTGVFRSVTPLFSKLVQEYPSIFLTLYCSPRFTHMHTHLSSIHTHTFLPSWCSLWRHPQTNLPGYVHHDSHAGSHHADSDTALS